ncbi:hypothetical protein RCOM_0351490 [Ricinus communis]|uniref:NAC domain-containing protein n=1 Tax=Ricinus communis TaxID=3988 RepID=B9T312_RICCO|nr:hypothetical protein RCOM_0351490 [Ricinus communis]
MGRETCTPPHAPAPPSAAAVGAIQPAGAVKTTALAPGFRFHPTDEELVSYYLKRKVSNKPVRFNAISEVDIYKNEPWELAAMKKTLVFHSGRAPGGQRTNWVMHEYRLVEEELDRLGALHTDSYVLCRVFHKNNIGPPNGNRYAPFLEEEWDDGETALVPGEDAADEVVVGHDNTEMNRVEQDNHSIRRDPLNINELPKDSQTVDEFRRHDLPVCKTERMDDCPPCVLNTEASFPLLQYKRRKHNDEMVSNRSNASENSTRTTQDPCSSTTSTGATTTTTDTTMTTATATTTAVSALLEFSLMESIEPKESPRVPTLKFDSFGLDSTVPPSCMKFINDLQSEIHKISVERETLKLEMMSAQAMINILQSRIDFLNKENEDLKRSIRCNQ